MSSSSDHSELTITLSFSASRYEEIQSKTMQNGKLHNIKNLISALSHSSMLIAWFDVKRQLINIIDDLAGV